ncbi:MAG: hypothetical protein ABH826_02990 [Patescibacteria group bacterium]
MKTITKLFLLLSLIMTFGLSATNVEARMPPIYPIWGYNTQDHICQIKQGSEESTINESLLGDYWSIRECRYENPEIIFYTGGGILFWLAILLFAFALHHIILPKLEKRSKTEKVLFFLQDVVVMGVILFFVVLLQHYFDIPKAVYPYTSDIDHIIYSTFIRDQIPITFAGAYLLISLTRAVFIYRKNKK